jgi:hypothetical protein
MVHFKLLIVVNILQMNTMSLRIMCIVFGNDEGTILVPQVD